MRKSLLLFAILAYACGDAQREEVRVSLQFKEVLPVPYYTRVFLRVSYPEGLPYQEEREGKFFPGDVVEFRLNLPEGEERTIEVVLFDDKNRPVYYRSLFLPKLSKSQEVIVELFPSKGEAKSYEIRSQGEVAQEKGLSLFSEDLYSINGAFDGYLVGKFIALREGNRSYFSYIPDKASSVGVRYEKEYTLTFTSDYPFYISGSAEGYPEKGQIKTTSGRLTLGREALLCAWDGQELYYAFSKNLQSLTLSPACPSSCVSYTYQFPQSFFPVEPILSYQGINCKGSFFMSSTSTAKAVLVNLPEGKHYIGLGFSFESPCATFGSTYTLAKDQFMSLVPKMATLSVPSPSSWRISSQDGLYEASAFCSLKEATALLLPYLEDKEVWIEREEENLVYARRLKLSGLSQWQKEDRTIKDLTLKKEGDTLFIGYKKEGSFDHCNLTLQSPSLSLYVEGIPSYRSYIRLSRNTLTEELFKEDIIKASLRCFFDGGYVEIRWPDAKKAPVY